MMRPGGMTTTTTSSTSSSSSPTIIQRKENTRLHRICCKIPIPTHQLAAEIANHKQQPPHNNTMNAQEPEFGLTALHQAVCHNSPEATKMLLEAGANPNIQDHNGGTPLHDAVANGTLQQAILLLQHGAAKDIKDNSGKTPLDYAKEKGFQGIVVLLQTGVIYPDTAAASVTLSTALHEMCYSDGSIPLESLASELQKKIHDVNTQEPQMLLTALHRASEHDPSGATKLLLEAGANPNIQDTRGWTALHAAANSGKLENVQFLLKYGADPSIKNYSGKTALDETRKKQYTDIALVLQCAVGGANPTYGIATTSRNRSDIINPGSRTNIGLNTVTNPSSAATSMYYSTSSSASDKVRIKQLEDELETMKGKVQKLEGDANRKAEEAGKKDDELQAVSLALKTRVQELESDVDAKGLAMTVKDHELGVMEHKVQKLDQQLQDQRGNIVQLEALVVEVKDEVRTLQSDATSKAEEAHKREEGLKQELSAKDQQLQAAQELAQKREGEMQRLLEELQTKHQQLQAKDQDIQGKQGELKTLVQKTERLSSALQEASWFLTPFDELSIFHSLFGTPPTHATSPDVVVGNESTCYCCFLRPVELWSGSQSTTGYEAELRQLIEQNAQYRNQGARVGLTSGLKAKIKGAQALFNPRLVQQWENEVRRIGLGRASVPVMQRQFRASGGVEKGLILDELETIIWKTPHQFADVALLFHGCSYSVAQNIITGGMFNLTNPEIDPGYFGTGIYLTDCLEYALFYSTGQHNGGSIDTKRAHPGDGTFVVLVCAVNLGCVYPVCRDVDYSKRKQDGRLPGTTVCNFYGEGMHHGCQSHLVPVDNFSFQATRKATAHAYEVVVKESAQVLPIAWLSIQQP